MIASFVFILLGGWFLYTRKTSGLQRFDLLAAWGIKLFACSLFLFVYTYYYGGGSLTADPEEFMNESGILANVAGTSAGDYLKFMFGLESEEMILTQIAETSHWTSGDLMLMNDSKNVIRVNSLLYFLSGGNAWAHCIAFAFVSLLGFRELYLTFYKYFAQRTRLFWYGIILIPSVAFWTAGMLKEPLMIVGLCLIIRSLFSELSVKGKVVRFLAGCLLMLAFKPYVFFCLLPLILWYFLAVKIRKSLRVTLLIAVPVIVVLGLNFLPQKRDALTQHLTRKQFDFINVGRGGMHVYADTCFFYFRPDQFGSLNIYPDSSVFLKKPIVCKMMTTGKTLPFKDVYLQPNKKRWIKYYNEYPSSSYITTTEIKGSYKQLLMNVPEALIISVLRPFPNDPGGVMKYFAFAESVILSGLLLFFGFRNWKHLPEKLKIQLTTLLLFSLLLSLLIGWTTPVLGAVVRYRIPVYLVFGLTILLLAFTNKKKSSNE